MADVILCGKRPRRLKLMPHIRTGERKSMLHFLKEISILSITVSKDKKTAEVSEMCDCVNREPLTKAELMLLAFEIKELAEEME